jgi:pyrroloquinoline quinone (PQQ) biosynthesis protein C
VQFFTLHRDIDPYHAKAVAELIERNHVGANDQAVALEAARTALKAVWDLLDCV